MLEKSCVGIFNPCPLMFQMGMVGPRMGQPNVNQLQNQYLTQGQFPGSGPGVGAAQSGMAQPGSQAGLGQVRRPEVIHLLVCVAS